MPLADSIGAMSEPVEQDKVRYLGLSEGSGAELRKANAIHAITAMEQEWSLLNRQAEDTTVPAAAELDVAIVPYSPRGCGFLTEKSTSAASAVRRYEARSRSTRADNAKANSALRQPVHDIAGKRAVTTAQVALA
ncbi:aryl-alcohol dehydrogenase-like predicted oxidoreductase [Rhodococcus erythropolis]|nr:aryl-alcohol dehydrogenase-like predicted oxidoreductase [Rhodococcus erythropolis]